MFAECLLFWLWCWLSLELAGVRFTASQLALVLSILLLCACLLILNGLDLLGVFVGSTYASVFVAVALITLQFGPFWAPAQREGGVAPARLQLWLLPLMVGLVVTLLDRNWSLTSWDGWLLWQELCGELSMGWPLQSGLLHWFFFRCFVLETIGLNLYLFLGLVGVIFFLSIRWLANDEAANSPKGVVGSSGLSGLLRMRLISRLRRQTRRTNASQLRHRR